MPAHRMCSTPGCGGPAVYGSLCWICAHSPEVNTIDFGDGGGVPWSYDVPRHFLDRAVARVLDDGQT